ncbi:MAG: LuxR C-terminal-related transcriptional regulator [Alphaproteobacteria bacterium]|nr:LuxR C-terminal-related transcriptional regulator [Alphaproteobacteria bacterium]
MNGNAMLNSDFVRRFGLPALFLLQFFCVLFLLADAVADVFKLESLSFIKDSDSFEYAVVIALIMSMAATGYRMRRVLLRNRLVENQLMAASGAFCELLELHFENWNLTASEREVALLAIKGFGIAEIADLRKTKAGTIKAQLNAIYKKADVTGRPQLISLFVEELMGDTLAPSPV